MANLNKTAAQLNDMFAQTLYLTDNTDCTAAIQAALDLKGHIKIVSEGTFLVSRLVIDSDTTLELCEGVTLKKKDGTNTNILTNKGYVTEPAYRNKNIHVKGGTWNLNSTGNTTPVGLGMIGLLFKGVDGLKITDVKSIGDEHKYCYLIADCKNIYCGNINFANESDGLHFQPPIQNLLIDGVTGWTHDDMISFTMGDYTPYVLGDIGDIENVVVRNIASADGTDEHIKLVGDGINGTSVFRNMRFENISGEATIYSICILERDQSVANPYLNHTYLENIVFSNINPKMSGNQSTFFITCTKGDITIENSNYNQSSGRYIECVSGNGGTIDKLTLRGVTSLTPLAKNLSSFIRCDSSVTISLLNIDDCKLDFSLATILYTIYPTNNSIKRLNIINSHFALGARALMISEGVSATDMIVHIANSIISSTGYLISTATPVELDICNSDLTLNVTTNGNIVYFEDGGWLKLKSSNNNYNTGVSIRPVTAVRKFSIKGIDAGFLGLLSTITPSEGDTVRSANASESTGKGLYYYNGAAWVKFTT